MVQIKDLQHELGEMQITLRELAKLEDYDGASYDEIVTDAKWMHQMLKHRLLTLQLKRDNQTTLDGERK